MSTDVFLVRTKNGVRVSGHSHTSEKNDFWATLELVPLKKNGNGLFELKTSLYLDEETIRAIARLTAEYVAEFDSAKETAE